jgi:hypothetical protein
MDWMTLVLLTTTHRYLVEAATCLKIVLAKPMVLHQRSVRPVTWSYLAWAIELPVHDDVLLHERATSPEQLRVNPPPYEPFDSGWWYLQHCSRPEQLKDDGSLAVVAVQDVCWSFANNLLSNW